MIDSIRAYNQKAPDAKKVKFLGLPLDRAIVAVEGYVRKVASEYADTAEEALKTGVR